MSYSTVEQVITQLRAFPGYYVSGVSLEAIQDDEEETRIHISLKNQSQEIGYDNVYMVKV